MKGVVYDLRYGLFYDAASDHQLHHSPVKHCGDFASSTHDMSPIPPMKGMV